MVLPTVSLKDQPISNCSGGAWNLSCGRFAHHGRALYPLGPLFLWVRGAGVCVQFWGLINAYTSEWAIVCKTSGNMTTTTNPKSPCSALALVRLLCWWGLLHRCQRCCPCLPTQLHPLGPLLLRVGLGLRRLFCPVICTGDFLLNSSTHSSCRGHPLGARHYPTLAPSLGQRRC